MDSAGVHISNMDLGGVRESSISIDCAADFAMWTFFANISREKKGSYTLITTYKDDGLLCHCYSSGVLLTACTGSETISQSLDPCHPECIGMFVKVPISGPAF